MRFLLIVFSWFFPPHCASCGTEGEWWCHSCVLPPICHQKDTHVSGWLYTQDAPRKLTHALKYAHAWPAAELLVSIWRQQGSSPLQLFAVTGPVVWVPIPTTPTRLRERGFHQSEVIARAMARVWGGKVRLAFTRKNQVSMVGKDKQARAVLASEGYGLRRGFKAQSGVCHILVDDTVTTGATLASCKQLLVCAGVSATFSVSLLYDP